MSKSQIYIIIAERKGSMDKISKHLESAKYDEGDIERQITSLEDKLKERRAVREFLENRR